MLDYSPAVKICNRALAAIEHSVTFEDFEDGSDEADEARLHYDDARKYVLMATDWRFASTLYKLNTTKANTVTPARTPYAYTLPPDCLIVRELPDEPPAPYTLWKTEGVRTLLANVNASAESPLLIRYTRDEENAALFPATFTEALVAYLGYLFSPRFASSVNRQTTQLNIFDTKLENAVPVDAQEASPAEYDGDAPVNFLDAWGRG